MSRKTFANLEPRGRMAATRELNEADILVRFVASGRVEDMLQRAEINDCIEALIETAGLSEI
jgi:hypothetical protein